MGKENVNNTTNSSNNVQNTSNNTLDHVDSQLHHPTYFRAKYWPSIREFLAGSFAGVGLIAAGQPFDTIKVRLQTEGGFGRFRGPIHCLLTTLKEERVFGLYKGSMGPLMGQGTISAIQFSLHATFLPIVRQYTSTPEERKGRASLKEMFIAGVMTGSLMFIPVTPIEGVKARLQVQYDEASTGVKPKYRGTIDAYKTIYRECGFRGLYKGALPTFITRLSFGWYILGYEMSKRFFLGDNPNGKLSPIYTMISGGVAGTCFWLSNYPIDVIKNRIQASPDVKPPLYDGFVDCARKIYRKEGWRGFTRGLSVCLIRSLPANATTFLFLEIARKFLPP